MINIEKEIKELNKIKGDAKIINKRIEEALINRGYYKLDLGANRKYCITSGVIKEMEIDGRRFIAYGISACNYKYRAYVKEID